MIENIGNEKETTRRTIMYDIRYSLILVKKKNEQIQHLLFKYWISK